MVDFQSRNNRRAETGRDDEDTGRTDSTNDDEESGYTPASTATGDEESATEGPVVGIAIVTISDDRTAEDDPGGDAVVEALESASHEVRTREILRPGHDSVQHAVNTLVKRDDVDVVVTTGGTGIASADVTVDAVRPLFDRDLPGFGEQFRRRYADTVGTDAIATRATAGIAETTPMFCLPGDPEGAYVATDEIVVEQASRLVRLASGDRPADP